MKATSSLISTGNEPSKGKDEGGRMNEESNLILPSDFAPINQVVSSLGALNQIGALARELGGTRALVVTDPGLAKVGHPQRAAELLRKAGLDVRVFDQVEENPTTHHVALGVAAAKEHQSDLLVAVGGGSAMDVAKGTNFILTNGGQMADYQGIGKATKAMLPSMSCEG